MNLVRHELGFSKTEKRFPAKGTCLAIYSRCRERRSAARRGARLVLSVVRGCGRTSCGLFAQYVEVKQPQHVLDYDDLLLYWAHMMHEAALAGEIGGRFDHVLVDEYQDTNKPAGLDPAGAQARRRGADRRRRRRAVDLLVSRGDGAQHPRFPGQFSPRADVVTLEQNYRSTQPILAAANAVIDTGAGALHQESLVGAQAAERPLLVARARRGRSGAIRGRAGAREPRGRHRAEAAGGVVPRVAP